jgi:hypothetical protein
MHGQRPDAADGQFQEVRDGWHYFAPYPRIGKIAGIGACDRMANPVISLILARRDRPPLPL